jgi:hypothetical protein
MVKTQSKCRIGFSCAAMMQQPGLEATVCPNRSTCNAMVHFQPTQRATLVRVGGQGAGVEASLTLSRQEAALLMLMDRGCPQTPNDFGVLTLIDQAIAHLTTLRSTIESTYQDGYIAPEGCEVHEYNVKRPKTVYERDTDTGDLQAYTVRMPYYYNKLAAPRAIFEPAIEPGPVKVIHLSHDDDPRNLEARRGIERRNRLMMLRSRLRNVEQGLRDALTALQRPMEVMVEEPDPSQPPPR